MSENPRVLSVAEPTGRSRYRAYRFPPEVIAHAVWMYFRFHLSFRDVQDLLAERAIVVSHEAIPTVVHQVWCRLRRRVGWYCPELGPGP